MKCKFSQNEAEERLIEQLIVGTNLSELQKELLGRDDKLTLEQALNIGRTHEASISHMSQLQGVPCLNYKVCRQDRQTYTMSKPAVKQGVISAPDRIRKTNVAQLIIRSVSGAEVKTTGK